MDVENVTDVITGKPGLRGYSDNLFYFLKCALDLNASAFQSELQINF